MTCIDSFISRIRSRIWAPLTLSRFAVGSSAMTSAGRLTSALAMATRCCWPPDSSFGFRRRCWPRPTASSIRSASPPFGMPASCIASSTFSRADNTGIRLNDWNTNPIRFARRWASSRRPMLELSLPSIRTRPESGRSSRPTRFNIVVLPDPEGPLTTVNSPASNATDTWSSALTAVVPAPYTRLVSSSSQIDIPSSEVRSSRASTD